MPLPPRGALSGLTLHLLPWESSLIPQDLYFPLSSQEIVLEQNMTMSSSPVTT